MLSLPKRIVKDILAYINPHCFMCNEPATKIWRPVNTLNESFGYYSCNEHKYSEESKEYLCHELEDADIINQAEDFVKSITKLLHLTNKDKFDVAQGQIAEYNINQDEIKLLLFLAKSYFTLVEEISKVFPSLFVMSWDAMELYRDAVKDIEIKHKQKD